MFKASLKQPQSDIKLLENMHAICYHAKRILASWKIYTCQLKTMRGWKDKEEMHTRSRAQSVCEVCDSLRADSLSK